MHDMEKIEALIEALMVENHKLRLLVKETERELAIAALVIHKYEVESGIVEIENVEHHVSYGEA